MHTIMDETALELQMVFSFSKDKNNMGECREQTWSFVTFFI